MRKNRVFARFHSWGHSNSILNFLNFLFYYVFVYLKEKKYDFWELKNIIYVHDSAIKNDKVHQWSLKARFTWFTSKNTLLNLFMPGEKLIQTANSWLSCTEYVIFAGLLWWIGLVHRKGRLTAKISASVEKGEIWNMKSWSVPLDILNMSRRS